MSLKPEIELSITFHLNGEEVSSQIQSQTVLINALRGNFDCNSVRASCERGVCGACTVLLDGEPVAACSTFAFDADGRTVETVEGLADADGTLSPEQKAFTECGGFQCGYCTSGMLMLTRALLREDPTPERATIREWISSNTCRCTGYEMIMESVGRAAEISAARKEQS